MKSLPKVLVISNELFNRDNNTGITLSNLFDGWDKEKLAQIYMIDGVPSTDVCTNYFYLKPQHAPFDYYIRKILHSYTKNRSSAMGSAGVVLDDDQKTIKNKIHLNLRAIAAFSPLFIPTSLYNWVNAFNPDIIYCMLGSIRMINLTNAIAKKTGKPIVPHFMDDWPSTFYTQNELMGLSRYLFEQKLNNTFSLSNGGLCISEHMVKEYKIRYNLPFTPFANCVDEAYYCPPINRPKKETSLLMYVGGLHLNRWKSLLQLSKAIEEINEFKKNISLKIYAPTQEINTYADYFNKYSSTQFAGSIKSYEVASALREADVLLHIESFEENYVKFTKYSLSTKIPQYMASGKPILAYGPIGIASIEHIKLVNAGKVICENNEKNIISDIRELISDNELLFLYASSGFKYAKNNYSKKNNLKRLAKILNEYSIK